VIEVGDLRLEVMATPGHAPGHVCFYERKHDILFGGDLIIGGTIGAPVAPASLGYRQQTSSATLAFKLGGTTSQKPNSAPQCQLNR
jgi:glyoxylase-like metal-dependent hydrolase (beta-lactamase superfamily II)